jgi:FMN phosphatase YigB (HAD superfamily)
MPNQGAGPIAITLPSEVVLLFDVDNTLLDNDRVQDDLRSHLEHEFGTETRDRYFAILEDLYAELGYGTIWELCSATGLRTSAIAGCC